MALLDLQRTWTRRGPSAWALLPVAGLYALLSSLHRGGYRWGLRKPQRLPVPVLVVGNVVAGGAGKTPVVVALVLHLQAMGLRAGVISRGHGRTSRGVREVRVDSDAANAGDEPLLIARRTGVPVFVGERRAEAGRALLARHPGVQVLVCDDGLQHLALARDIDICVFDERGIGNGWPLPAGPLREPWPRPVDFILRPAAGTAGVSSSAVSGDATAPAAPTFSLERRLGAEAVNSAGERAPLGELAARSPLALAGIARPQAFFAMLGAAGCPPAQALPFPDHHDFRQGPSLPEGRCLVCTEKDAVKLWPLRPDAWAVPLEVTIEDGFWHALDARLASLVGQRAQAPAGPRLSSGDGSQTA